MRMLAALIMFTFAAPPQTALPADVRAACDNAFAIVTKSQGIKTRRSAGTFREDMFPAPVTGCRIDVDGSFKKAGKNGAPVDNLGAAFIAQGWTEVIDFSSDGHDGTSFAYRKGAAACFVRGSWDGGSDDEPEVPAGDDYKAIVICGAATQFVRPR